MQTERLTRGLQYSADFRRGGDNPASARGEGQESVSIRPPQRFDRGRLQRPDLASESPHHGNRFISSEDRLALLVERQLAKTSEGEFESFSPSLSGQELLSGFHDSSHFNTTYRHAMGKSLSRSDQTDYVETTSGVLFQGFGFWCLSGMMAKRNDGSVVLPHEDMLSLHAGLFSSPRLEEDEKGELYLPGKYTPDGVVVDNQGRISYVVEYKVFPYEDDVSSQVQAFNYFVHELEDLRADHPRFLLLTPQVDIEQIPTAIRKRPNTARHIMLPISFDEWGAFTRSVRSEYRGGASLNEMNRYVRGDL